MIMQTQKPCNTIVPFQQINSETFDEDPHSINNALPSEILTLILSKLPLSNLPSCSLVCKYWNQVAIESKKIHCRNIIKIPIKNNRGMEITLIVSRVLYLYQCEKSARKGFEAVKGYITTDCREDTHKVLGKNLYKLLENGCIDQSIILANTIPGKELQNELIVEIGFILLVLGKNLDVFRQKIKTISYENAELQNLSKLAKIFHKKKELDKILQKPNEFIAEQSENFVKVAKIFKSHNILDKSQKILDHLLKIAEIDPRYGFNIWKDISRLYLTEDNPDKALEIVDKIPNDIIGKRDLLDEIKKKFLELRNLNGAIRVLIKIPRIFLGNEHILKRIKNIMLQYLNQSSLNEILKAIPELSEDIDKNTLFKKLAKNLNRKKGYLDALTKIAEEIPNIQERVTFLGFHVEDFFCKRKWLFSQVRQDEAIELAKEVSDGYVQGLSLFKLGNYFLDNNKIENALTAARTIPDSSISQKAELLVRIIEKLISRNHLVKALKIAEEIPAKCVSRIADIMIKIGEKRLFQGYCDKASEIVEKIPSIIGQFALREKIATYLSNK